MKANILLFGCVVLASFPMLSAEEPVSMPFKAAVCEGHYSQHLQGVCTDNRNAIYWSFTNTLVKTDSAGKLIEKVPVACHHGDLCYVAGKVYVAVNLGKFNRPAGQADSWVYVYDAVTLVETARHKVAEAVHGAGGIAWAEGHFFVVGGLPAGIKENYVFEYDDQFVFQKKHVIASGYTEMGIQTAVFDGMGWWFGCYGGSPELLKTDLSFKLLGKYKFDCSLGLAPLPTGQFLAARGQ